MLLQRKKRVICIGIMLVLTAFVGMATNVSADDLVADAGGPYEVYECEDVSLDASGSYGGAGSLEYRWNFSSGWTEWSSGYTYTTRWLDNDYITIFLEVSDGSDIAGTTTSVTVLNRAPQNLSMEGPNEVDIGEETYLDVRFFDGLPDPRGFVTSLDTYTVTIDWKDGSLCDTFLFVPDDVIEYGLEMYFALEAIHIYFEAGTYQIQITIIDDDGGELIGYWTVIVNGNIPAPNVDAGENAIIDEGSTFFSVGSLSDTTNTFSSLVDYGDGTGIQDLLLKPGNTYALQHVYGDNGIYSVIVKVYYDGEECGSDEVIVTVNNVAPTIESLIGSSADPVSLGSAYQLTGSFSDPGFLDTHIASIDWGDGQITNINVLYGSYEVTGNHVYAATGVYQITLTVTDDDGGSDTMSLEYYVVIYNPGVGFVTGGGWIIAQPGSYPANSSYTGKATFGFVSKYKKGQTTPEGNTEFQLHGASLNFHSHVYEWLVVAGSLAMYKGTGTINGVGNYGFLVTIRDGQVSGGGGIDTFRIKIWDKNNGDLIVFDNNGDTELGGGQITIHKA